jgi:hypothetical protein
LACTSPISIFSREENIDQIHCSSNAHLFHVLFLGLFGSAAIHWMAVDIHFSSGYPLFGLKTKVDRDNQMLTIFSSNYG